MHRFTTLLLAFGLFCCGFSAAPAPPLPDTCVTATGADSDDCPDLQNYSALFSTDGWGEDITEHTHSYELWPTLYSSALPAAEDNVVLNYGENGAPTTVDLLQYLALASTLDLPEPEYPTAVTFGDTFSNGMQFTTDDGTEGWLWASWQDETGPDYSWANLKTCRIQYQGKHTWLHRNPE